MSALSNFILVTQASETTAQRVLDYAGGNLDVALRMYFENPLSFETEEHTDDFYDTISSAVVGIDLVSDFSDHHQLQGGETKTTAVTYTSPRSTPPSSPETKTRAVSYYSPRPTPPLSPTPSLPLPQPLPLPVTPSLRSLFPVPSLTLPPPSYRQLEQLNVSPQSLFSSPRHKKMSSHSTQHQAQHICWPV